VPEEDLEAMVIQEKSKPKPERDGPYEEPKTIFQRSVSYRQKSDLITDKHNEVYSLEARLKNEDLNLIERAKLQ